MSQFSRKVSKAEIISELAISTGLKRETVKDLMKSGWTFERQESGRLAFLSPGPKR